MFIKIIRGVRIKKYTSNKLCKQLSTEYIAFNMFNKFKTVNVNQLCTTFEMVQKAETFSQIEN